MPLGFGLCPALGTFFALAAAILLIFVNIGQVSDSQAVPRHIQIIDFTTYGVGNALATLANVDLATADAVHGNVDQARGSYDVGSGLRYTYSWGLWSRCGGYGNSLSQIQFCTSTQFAEPFQPFSQVLVRDVPGAQNTTLLGVIPDSTFTADNYLGSFSKGAFYLIFVGAILNGLALLVGFAAHHIAFLLASGLAFLAFLCELVGAVIWTAITVRVRSSINDVVVQSGSTQVPLGIHVGFGNALWMLWAAAGCLFIATIPYLLGCCTGRGRREKEYY